MVAYRGRRRGKRGGDVRVAGWGGDFFGRDAGTDAVESGAGRAAAGITEDLRTWVNRRLMTLFFLVAGWRRGASSTSATCATGAGSCCRARPGRTSGT
ncbi:hypothetical protein GCM10020358_17630 [Amorphoplanes nipponensis]|uniref:Uncharacterized protein n=1 Tax=Actinoplanes nipponensis TaxID=135950 RepID=A0A919JK57_9ACTN|nr:hypothetical protein Ani05nite_42050 [Actinoplanes nipponensis]